MKIPPVDAHTMESVSPLEGGLGKQDSEKHKERIPKPVPLSVVPVTRCENLFARRQAVLFQPVVGIDGVIKTLRATTVRTVENFNWISPATARLDSSGLKLPATQRIGSDSNLV